MGQQARAVLKTYFETGDLPTEAQFIDLIDSLVNIVDDGTINNIVNKAVDYTAVINDYILVTASVAHITITLPTAVGVTGQEINITKVDATTYNIIVATTSAQTIIGNLTETISKQWSNATFISDGSNWIVK